MGSCNSKGQSAAPHAVINALPSGRSRRRSNRAVAANPPSKQRGSTRGSANGFARGNIDNGAARHNKPRLVTAYNDDARSHSTKSVATQSQDDSDEDRNIIHILDETVAPPTSLTTRPGGKLIVPSISVLPTHHDDASSQSSPTTAKMHRDRGSSQRQLARKYRVLDRESELGHGVSAKVREGVHRRTLRPCAIKTIDKSLVQRKDRIRREISLLKQVRHPNIVRMHDVYEDEDEVHIVTDLCRGGELFDRIVARAAAADKERREEMNNSSDNGDNDGCGEGDVTAMMPACYHERDAARIIRSLLCAVSYLHASDIVHRDIKPENILFETSEEEDDENDDSGGRSSSSKIKLIDFGLSARHSPDRHGPLTNTVGTSYYMAPEVLDGSYDRSCDMWSVGVVAYMMLSGRPPFNGPNDDIIFKKILRGRYGSIDDPVLWGGVSGNAKDFVRRLLDVDATRRWSADMALCHPWMIDARRQ